MGKIKTYKQFKESRKVEAFTITLDQLPGIGDVVDKVDWKEGDKVAFVDFRGIKNIPVTITDNETADIQQDIQNTQEIEVPKEIDINTEIEV